MKVLIISHEKNLNGASLSLLSIIDWLYSFGYEFWIVTAYVEGPFVEALQKRNVHILFSDYVRWMGIKQGRFKWFVKKILWWLFGNRKNKLVVNKLIQVITENNIDLVYSNTRVVEIGAKCAAKAQIHHVWHFREFGEEDFNMYPLDSYKHHYNFIAKYAGTIVCNSNAVKSKFIDHLPYEMDIRTIYNGLEVPIIKNTHNCDKVIFLIAGRVSVAKGQHYALAAAKRLEEADIDSFELWIAGEDRGDYKAFNQLRKSCSLNVKILGYQKDMTHLREISDVELVCSEKEAFGRVTIEAMLAGNPVIGSDSGGTSELIEDGLNGFLYKPHNLDDLSNKMAYFISNHEEISRMGNYAMKSSHQKFTLENYVNSINDLFKELLQK